MDEKVTWFRSAVLRLVEVVKAAIDLKFDKSGGDISGSVKVNGTFTLGIPDEDYDAGIRFLKSLDDNAGTVLTLQGYANGEEITTYRPVIRGIANPVSDYDLANKRYVDSKIANPDSYIVFLNEDGSISTYSSSISYSKIKGELTDYKTDVFLDVIYTYTEDGATKNTRVHIPALQDMDVNAGPIVFAGSIRMYNGSVTEAVFLLDSSNQLTAHYTTRENALYKVTDLETYAASLLHYPTVKGVWDAFQRKPVVIWEVDGVNVTAGLNAIQSNLSASPAWQLTGLDFSPYKRIKVYSKAGKGSTNAGTTAAMILEISLDSRMASTAWGGHYVGSVLSQKPLDNNRYASLTCAVSADKTSFVVLWQSSLYGTAATANNDIGASVVLIEGYYD